MDERLGAVASIGRRFAFLLGELCVVCVVRVVWNDSTESPNLRDTMDGDFIT